MRIINLNPDSDIGASAWFVEMDGHRLLMDSGTHPKLEGYPSLPLFKLIAKEDVDRAAVLEADQVLVGRNKTRLDYNDRLRELKSLPRHEPVVGDRLVCLRNNPVKKLLKLFSKTCLYILIVTSKKNMEKVGEIGNMCHKTWYF